MADSHITDEEATNSKNNENPNGNDDESRIVLASEVLPENLVIIPVRNRPLFPGMVLPIWVTGRFVDSIHFVEGDNKSLGVVLVKPAAPEDVEPDHFYLWGTVAKIIRVHKNPDQSLQVLVRTVKRFRIEKFLRAQPNIVVRAYYPEEITSGDSQEVKALLRSVITETQGVVRENPLIPEEIKASMRNIDPGKPGLLSDIAASLTGAETEELQDVLETIDITDRLRKVLLLLKKEADLIRLQKQISQEIQEKIDKQQKEYFLREQLKLIKRELGMEMDDKSLEINRIEEKLAALELQDQVRSKIEQDLSKMKMTEPQSPEFGVLRTYLDLVVSLPWNRFSKDITDLKRARKILDQDHYGLRDVKERIIEFIATMIMRKKVQGSIICLVGPPGVGKTSVGKSIARALNRKFYRFSLGGMRDEAEIKGHRRTYIGAMPGKIINALKYCQTSNPVIMLDEIDKLSHGFMGDPSSALLEVLDPEQNSDFIDHYLDIPFDLSRILFITTANIIDSIPLPLLDRMEIIRLSGYIAQEKVEIGRRYLLPKQRKANGLTGEHLSINAHALRTIAEEYAREAGVRNMEKQISTICRKVAIKIVQGDTAKVRVTRRNLEKYLGKPPYKESPLQRQPPVGVSIGLAWTALGGAVLRVESVSIGSKRGFKQTGQLGDVMTESASIAYSYICSATEKYGVSADFFDKHYIHLHVPEGATPKDGPSAGITMALSILSLARNQTITPAMAMTGELTLTGEVLPIGGLREKVIAARRNNIEHIIIPELNRSAFDELQDYLKKDLSFHLVKHFDEVVQIAFSKQ